MMTMAPQLGNLIKKLSLAISDVSNAYIYRMQKTHYVSVVYCALCISVILQSSVHTSDAFTKKRKTLLRGQQS